MECQVSVVIASLNGLVYLDACLAALSEQASQTASEIIVVDRLGQEISQHILQHYPTIQYIQMPPDTSLEGLRTHGIHVAQGALIAITEDHCLPANDWLESIMQAHAQHEVAVIGGVLANTAHQSTMDEVAFWLEYYPFVGIEAVQETHQLAAANVSYKRGALLQALSKNNDLYYEGDVHRYFVAHQQTMLIDPRLRVDHRLYYSFKGYLIERYCYGRWYGAKRAHGLSYAARIRYLILIPFLPAIIIKRIIQHTQKSQARQMLRLPHLLWLLFFIGVWAWGEWVGNLTKSPSNCVM